MIERTKQRLNLTPNRLAADTVYGTGKLLGWLVGAGIAPHIPVWEKGKRNDGTFSRSDFMFDKEKNECPNGKVLRTTGRVHDGRTILYRASKFDCDPCPLKLKCCPNVAWRKVPRDERKRVEMRFAHLKTHHRFERMRLRGLTGARDEFHLGAIAQNLKTLANHLWRPRPNEPAACMT